MLPEVLRHLRCPVCGAPLAAAPGAVRCPAGHAFDLARQGYVNLLRGRSPGTGDDAAMVAARETFLGAGHFAPLGAALARAAEGHAGRDGLVVEVGAGTGHHLRSVLEALPDRFGLALDLSRHAARRAARAHPRLAAVVADAWERLPVADACAALVLDVFAPRNAAEFRRVLAPDGALLLVTPAPAHLAELRGPLGLLEVDPDKARRVSEALEGRFALASSESLAWTLSLAREDVVAAARMGPSAHHTAADVLAARVAALEEPVRVTAAVQVQVYRPTPNAA
ncbi:putative RNA methyltransferase [Anaeromyxobacter sp. PSR-1]|uniref:putative RNA methyltransferase n=1 Tax=unclassified Anaeromyxobacter TaxID=2620896 RepID=UPI0005E1332D|nr:methyltransferase domain-containing protein [Anaeromyxobacter sp. PSR-1]GAO02132.1 putative 23S rRNA (guanine-N(1)-)-methyltransferase [Anaeromyxobacter sp. PSR-1]